MRSLAILAALVLGGMAASGCFESTPDTGDVDVSDSSDVSDVSDVSDIADVVDVVEEADAEDVTENAGEFSMHAAVSASFGYTFNTIAGPFCRCEPPLADTSETVAEEGGCALVRSSGAQDWSHCTSLDVGDVYVSFDGNDYLLSPVEDMPDMPCLRGELMSTIPEPAAGTVVRFHSTGGSDLPAFDYSLTMPVTIAIESPAADATLTTGDAWSVSWTPTAAESVRVMFDGNDVNMFCWPTAAPPFVAPATLTSLWDETGIVGRVSTSTSVDEARDGAIPLHLSLSRAGGSAPVNYAAGD